MSLPALPLPREWELPFDPLAPAGTRVVRVACPTGLTAWLVSDYAGVREVLGDGRTRVPGLRLAVPVGEIEWKRDTVVRGPVELPVAWS